MDTKRTYRNRSLAAFALAAVCGLSAGSAFAAPSLVLDASRDAESDAVLVYSPGPRPPYVRVRSFQFAGSGCPAGSAYSNISSVGSSASIHWDSFVAEIGPGVPLAASRRNCQMLLDLDVPAGWTYTIAAVDLGGYARLDPGVSGVVTWSFYFQGQRNSETQSFTLQGPLSQDFHIRDTVGVGRAPWSPCGGQRALNVNVSARVSATGVGSRAQGMLSLEPADGYWRRAPLFSLRWQRC